MAEHETVIRNAAIVTTHAVIEGDLAISEGVFTVVGGPVSGSTAHEIDATGLVAFPGCVDSHVHFNEPGRTDWEGFASGSLALAAGGATTFVDMPLNSNPPLLTGQDFDNKLAAARGKSRVDFGFWGGLVEGSQRTMPELAERGVVGFKGFMCDSGIPEFPRVGDHTLYEGMKTAADLGLPILLHAENEEITRELTRVAREEGRIHEMRDFLATRPIIAEVEAIQRAILFAKDTGCTLHIVHVSSAQGAQAVLDAQGRGVDVSLETCPQYLLLDEDDLEQLGAHAKAGPPPRGGADQATLWEMVLDGRIPMVVSDHSPSSPDLKAGRPLLDCWGGISGCQSTLQLMLEYGHSQRAMPLQAIGRALSGSVADRFGLPGKGRIEVGYDADLALVDVHHVAPLERGALHYRHQQSAYLGMPHRGRIARTILRGETVFAAGTGTSRSPDGQVIRLRGRYLSG